MQLSVNKGPAPPNCYGRDWDRNEPECAGGADANYTHPVDGTHVRAQCNWFQSCGVRLQATRAAPPVIPASSLVRPPQPQPQAGNFGEYLRQQEAAKLEAMRQAALNRPIMPGATPYGAPVPQAGAWQGPIHYPAPSYQLNYQMPGYLSVPEIHHPGESLFSVLLREFFRALVKAGAHAVSHFADVRLFRTMPLAPPPGVTDAPPPPKA